MCTSRTRSAAALPARERILVHRPRQHAVGLRAVLADDDRDHALEALRPRHVEPQDLPMTDRAAEDPPDQRVAVIEVGRIARAPGDLVDAVRQPHARPRPRPGRGGAAPGAWSTGARPDSTALPAP